MELAENERMTLAPGEDKKIKAALAALAANPHAPREVAVKVLINIHQEYPKHVNGKVVNSAEEETAAGPQTPAPAAR